MRYINPRFTYLFTYNFIHWHGQFLQCETKNLRRCQISSVPLISISVPSTGHSDRCDIERLFYVAHHHRRSWRGSNSPNSPRIQDWQSTKNQGLEGPTPYVLLELLFNEKLRIYRVRIHQNSPLGDQKLKTFSGEGNHPIPRPSPSREGTPPPSPHSQLDPTKNLTNPALCPQDKFLATPMRTTASYSR